MTIYRKTNIKPALTQTKTKTPHSQQIALPCKDCNSPANANIASYRNCNSPANANTLASAQDFSRVNKRTDATRFANCLCNRWHRSLNTASTRDSFASWPEICFCDRISSRDGDLDRPRVDVRDCDCSPGPRE